MEYNKEEFTGWLRNNTTLLEGSISVYGRVIDNFFKEYDKCSLRNIKEFISKHNREANSTHIRTPFFHFFKYSGLSDKLYNNLPKVRKMPKKKEGVYLTDPLMRKLINSIDKRIYRDISKLRYFTGIRAIEALTIKEEKIKTNVIKFKKGKEKVSFKVTEITIISKGGKERTVYLRYNLGKKILRKYITNQVGFIFIPRSLGLLETDNKALFWKKTQTQVKYYYNALQDAAKAIGLKSFGTHDFRRFFTEKAIKNYDIEIVQKMLGHSRIETTLLYVKNKSKEATEAMIELQEN